MNTLQLDTPVITRSELLRLSGFMLPARAERRDVPALTLERTRTLERYGCFDTFQLSPSRKHQVVCVWRRRKRGERRLYSLRDALVARLAAWMLRDGLSMREVVLLIRGCSVRVCLDASTAELVWAWKYGTDPVSGCCTDWKFLKGREPFSDRPGYREWWFPLDWLGFRRDVLPRVQKMRRDQPTIVTNRRPLTPAQIVAEQARLSNATDRLFRSMV